MNRCKNLLLMSEIQTFLDPGIREELSTQMGNISIYAAKIEHLYRCKKCDIPQIVDTIKPNFVCFSCKFNNCKNCEREYVGNHEGRTCQELINFEMKEGIRVHRNKNGTELNEMYVHRCHRCRIQFLKYEGCNFITCRCKATQCYVCRAPDIDGNHFRQGKCEQFAKYEVIEETRMKEERIKRGITDLD
uniref:RING-type domain-containing protein n=1 Tax=Panagrolaimus sp. JU765 TaxID=591449 RepID=A0AC34QWL9_9BILA